MTGIPAESGDSRPSDQQGCFAILITTAGRLFVHAFAAAIIFVVFCSSFLKATEYFIQEDMKAPVVTVQIWNIAWWLNGWGIVGVPVLLLIDGAILAGLQSLPRAARWLASVWFSLVLTACIVLLGLANFAVVGPLHLRMNHDDEPAPAHPVP